MSSPRLSDPGGEGCILVGCASFALAFCAIFARRELNAQEDTAGIYLVCATAAAVLSNLVLGQVSDRRRNRSVLRLAAVTAVLPMIVASVPDPGPDTRVNKSLISALVFAFVGLHATADSIGNINYVLELAPAKDRSIHVGFADGVVGLALFASPLGGAIVDSLGFVLLFRIALACGLVALALSMRLEEPRKRAASAVEEL